MSGEFISPARRTELQRGFYKNWYIKLNDPQSQRGLWLRFTLLSSGNGFKRVAEVWAVYFQRGSDKSVKKVAIKQTHDIRAFLASNESDIRIGNCSLLPHRTSGLVESKGQSIQWNLTLLPTRESSIHFVPNFLAKAGIERNSIVTLCEELLFSGTTEINGEKVEWKEAPGMQGYWDGIKNGHSWVWGHCNSFMNDRGKAASFLFEGFSRRSQVGPIVIPRLSSFYFFYQNEHYHFNTLRDALYVKSKNSLNHWTFQADRGDLSFRGEVGAEYKDFAGLTFEDTNGSLLYCSHSELADLTIHVYRRGKLEATFVAPASAGFEVVSRQKNPYVPVLI